MGAYVAEFLGTTILCLMGNGVVANVVLKQTKGFDSGWLVITTGWGLAVFTAVLCVAEMNSGAHLNPAVTIGAAIATDFSWSAVPGYLIAQLLGGIFGGALVYVFYKSHFDLTDDPAVKLGAFANAPAVRTVPLNLFCEVIGTFVLVFAVLSMTDPGTTIAGERVKVDLGSIGAANVGLVVFAIGICLGGTTGYAINPARDLGPRIAHAMLPIKDKGPNDWEYSWIPVVGPILGGIVAAILFLAVGGGN